jgi:hypothetical protein
MNKKWEREQLNKLYVHIVLVPLNFFLFIFCYTDSDMEWFVVHCEKKTYAIYIAL